MFEYPLLSGGLLESYKINCMLNGPIYKLFIPDVTFPIQWIFKILGPFKLFKGQNKISKGSLKIENCMGHARAFITF